MWPSQVAERLCVSSKSARAWQARWRAGGRAGSSRSGARSRPRCWSRVRRRTGGARTSAGCRPGQGVFG
ncbi:hypothetical protein OH738_40725 (plasmid) [Streptomyces hirsutus]|nr:hypothetical protein OH738_40725 [Streptomyces hirsutus]